MAKWCGSSDVASEQGLIQNLFCENCPNQEFGELLCLISCFFLCSAVRVWEWDEAIRLCVGASETWRNFIQFGLFLLYQRF